MRIEGRSLASEALHARVAAFIRASDASGDERPGADAFDELALSIARYQAEHVAPVSRLCRARGVDLDAARSAAQIPAVPCDVFRHARVAAHPDEEDVRVFRTSGTSAGAGLRGEHPMRTLATYELAALTWGRRMLLPDAIEARTIALAPSPGDAPDSSLSFMIDLFTRAVRGASSWHVLGGELDLAGLTGACEAARSARVPALVMGTSFAFVHLLDALGDTDALRLPEGSRVMQTGGFKGRSREVSADTLGAGVAAAFGVPRAQVIGEYGMTELSSQLYQEVGSDLYRAPPWVAVVAVDEATLSPAAARDGPATGLARIVDLANVDSAVAIQTSDRVEVCAAGVRLLGRAPGAPPRGCSIAIDEILGGAGR